MVRASVERTAALTVVWKVALRVDGLVVWMVESLAAQRADVMDVGTAES